MGGAGVFSATGGGAGFPTGTGLGAFSGAGGGVVASGTRSDTCSRSGGSFEMDFGLRILLVAGIGVDFFVTGGGVLSTAGRGAASTRLGVAIVAFSTVIAEVGVGSGLTRIPYKNSV